MRKSLMECLLGSCGSIHFPRHLGRGSPHNCQAINRVWDFSHNQPLKIFRYIFSLISVLKTNKGINNMIWKSPCPCLYCRSAQGRKAFTSVFTMYVILSLASLCLLFRNSPACWFSCCCQSYRTDLCSHPSHTKCRWPLARQCIYGQVSEFSLKSDIGPVRIWLISKASKLKTGLQYRPIDYFGFNLIEIVEWQPNQL